MRYRCYLYSTRLTSSCRQDRAIRAASAKETLIAVGKVKLNPTAVSFSLYTLLNAHTHILGNRYIIQNAQAIFEFYREASK